MPRPGIEPGTPGSLIERHNHEAKRSGPVRLVIYAPYIFTYILIICTSLCRATTTYRHDSDHYRTSNVKTLVSNDIIIIDGDHLSLPSQYWIVFTLDVRRQRCRRWRINTPSPEAAMPGVDEKKKIYKKK